MGGGFVFQPGLAYQVKSTDIKKDDGSAVINSIKTSVGYVEADTQLQWGPDLMVFRPFVLVDPFLGYAVNTKAKAKGAADDASLGSTETAVKDAVRKIEYGLGVGGGIDGVDHMRQPLQGRQDQRSVFQDRRYGEGTGQFQRSIFDCGAILLVSWHRGRSSSSAPPVPRSTRSTLMLLANS